MGNKACRRTAAGALDRRGIGFIECGLGTNSYGQQNSISLLILLNNVDNTLSMFSESIGKEKMVFRGI